MPQIIIRALLRARILLVPACLSIAACVLCACPAIGQQFTFSSLYSFYGADGTQPFAPLVQAADGNLYGTTNVGGTAGLGAVFRMSTAGREAVLHEFTGGGDGSGPFAGLMQASDGNLYGTTPNGGTSSSGTAFRVTPTGGYLVIHTFSGGTADGASPLGALVEGTDGNLYGTTQGGGASGNGVVFRMSRSGGSDTVLHSFAGGASDGAKPHAGLVLASDGNFYGVTTSGGSANGGTVFRITPSGTVTILHSFAGGNADGSDPLGALIEASDGNLYGTAVAAGPGGQGVVFKISLAGTYSVLYGFAGGSDGANPFGGVAQASDGNLYGTTALGGSAGAGTVFKVSLTGSESVLHAFAGGTTDGSQPLAAVIQASDGNLYGTTATGGAGNNNGVVFRVTPAGAESVLYTFPTNGGTVPVGGALFATDGNLYGTANEGGAFNNGFSGGNGAVYVMTPDGAVNTLYSFKGGTGDGLAPTAALTEGADGAFYSTTNEGGANSGGTIFRITSGGVETVLDSFGSASVPGLDPIGGLTLASDGNFYGNTEGGGSRGSGEFFKVTPAGAYTGLFGFGGSNLSANDPFDAPAQGSDGNFYSTTEQGGAANEGTLVRLTPSGTETFLHDFDTFAGDGAFPFATPLQASDGNLYGTAPRGGDSFSDGVVWKFDLATGTASILYTFQFGVDGHDGSNPQGALIQGPDGALYGTTLGGGLVNDGTVFRLTLNGTETQLHAFDGTDGANPVAGLTQGPDGAFYGVTQFGGQQNEGTIFVVAPIPATLVELFPSTKQACGPGFTLTVDGSNFDSSAVVDWNGAALPTTFVSSVQLTATVPAADIATPGTATVTVKQLGSVSNGLTFTITNPTPVMGTLSPASTDACGPAFTLTVNGSCFIPSSVVDWNGISLATTFVSASTLTAAVPAADIAAPGTASVTVVTPSPGGGTSAPATFTITNPLPVLKSISPASADAGGPAFTLTVKGACFLSSSVVNWNGSALATTFVSATELKAAVPAGLIAAHGTAKVTVVTSSPGGGTSASKTFTILVTSLTLTGASLVRNADGSYTATISLKNTGFQAANSAEIKSSSLGGAATTTTLPVSLGGIAPGATITANLNYPSSAGAPGAHVKLKVSGTFTGGKFVGSLAVTLP